MDDSAFHHSDRLKQLYLQARELPEVERAGFLDERYAGDPELRARIESLLAHDVQMDQGFLQAATHLASKAPTGPLEAAAHRPPLMIGPFRLLERIGEGGFGEVYLAEQTEPVRRRVAIKIIKPGMDTRQVIARFEAERQALAVMDHSCIAKVFDGGTTEQGRAYFVMEYVKGEPITEFCDAQRMSINDRLHLMIRVCDAVQHAHQKGIIHRDIKPSNILVAYDGDGKATPKVIDFGVAKALNQKLSEATIFTERGQLIGTPEYMSPEQAEMSGLDIDTRSDVYSLGVLLYELLTGALPFDPKTLRAAGFAEIQRIIREVDPPKPSTRLSTWPEATPSVARQRRTEARALAGALRHDLDWIVMKCIEKDRERRYDTANALAAELRRYLRNEPVMAGPPSPVYRLRKYSVRHRGELLAATVILILLVVATIVSSTGWLHARRQQLLAQQALIDLVRDGLQTADERKIRDRAAAAGLALQVETDEHGNRRFQIDFDGGDEIPKLAAYAGQIFAWLQEAREVAEQRSEELESSLSTVDEMFRTLEPTRGGYAITVREMFDQSAESLAETEQRAPHVAGRIHRTLAEGYFALDEYERAVLHADRAVELLCHEDVLAPDCLWSRLLAIRVASRTGTYLRGVGRQDMLGRGAIRDAAALVAELEQAGADPGLLAAANMEYALSTYAMNSLEDALELFRVSFRLAAIAQTNNSSVELPPIYSNLELDAFGRIGQMLVRLGRFDEAVPIYDEVLSRTAKEFGTDSLEYATRLEHCAWTYRNKGDYRASLGYVWKSISVARQLVPSANQLIAAACMNGARSLNALGETGLAPWLQLEGLCRFRQGLGPHAELTVAALRHVRQSARLTDDAQGFATVVEAWDAQDYDRATELAEELIKSRFGEEGVVQLLAPYAAELE